MEALHEPHVDLNTDGIESVSATGITTLKGNFVEVDRIILATGFDTSFRPKYEIRAKGKSLSDVWATRSKGAPLPVVPTGMTESNLLPSVHEHRGGGIPQPLLHVRPRHHLRYVGLCSSDLISTDDLRPQPTARFFQALRETPNTLFSACAL